MYISDHLYNQKYFVRQTSIFSVLTIWFPQIYYSFLIGLKNLVGKQNKNRKRLIRDPGLNRLRKKRRKTHKSEQTDLLGLKSSKRFLKRQQLSRPRVEISMNTRISKRKNDIKKSLEILHKKNQQFTLAGTKDSQKKRELRLKTRSGSDYRET